MSYSSSKALEQVLKRRDRLRKKREKRRLVCFSLSLCAILLVLTLTVSSTPVEIRNGAESAAMGSFLLEARTGGIFAALVLAFLLGVLITLLCIRKKTNSGTTDENRHSQNEKNGGKQS